MALTNAYGGRKKRCANYLTESREGLRLNPRHFDDYYLAKDAGKGYPLVHPVIIQLFSYCTGITE